MNNLSIRSKLIVVFGALLLVFVGSSAWSLYSLSSINDDVATVINGRIPRMVLADKMNMAVSNLRAAELTHIISNTPAEVAEAEIVVKNQNKIINDITTKLDNTLIDPQAKALFATFKESASIFFENELKVLNLSRALRNDEAWLQFKSTSKVFDSMSENIVKLAQRQTELVVQDGARIEAIYTSNRNTIIVVLALSIAGVLAALFLLVRTIAKPLGEMTNAMGKMATGDLSVVVPDDGRKDEVGALAKAMGMFRDQLNAAETAKVTQTALIVDSVGTGLDRLSKGDLTSRIDSDLTGPFAKLKTDFNKAMSEIQSVMQLIAQSTGGIHTGAGEISQASDDLSRRTEQQAASLEETAAAMDEITATVRETASNASRANSVVSDTRSEVEQSGEVVRRAVGAMHGIEKASTEISEIIAVIDGIAFQTNLLALNAGVEAARAGDAGRGFAVVASEVRALAQRSADAAKDVKSRITASSEQVVVGVDLVTQTGKSLDRIIGRISEISELISGIAESSQQQAAGLQQVNTAVGEMDGVTQQNAAMVEEATAAARSLSSEADELARQIGRFELGAENRASAPSASTRPAPAAHPVHAMQHRAATQARRAPAPAPRSHGNTAMKAEEDWSEF